MTEGNIAHPPIVTEDEWLAARKAHLDREKQLTRELDKLRAERRRLPMVKLDKEYSFDGPQGRASLLQLFQGRRQLIVYHFMFDPSWEKGCMGCTGYADALGDLSMLQERDTTFLMASRAPLAKLEAYKKTRGWKVDWVSSFGSDFNYDFHATLDESVKPVQYNYRTPQEMKAAKAPNASSGEEHGLSVFFRVGNEVFHTYSTYARGTESLTDSYSLLDVTPYGRQESFEDSPTGWPQKPTYG
jgi:predicted dithiol-disulfide oxidoreductase (DUF899 family)